MAQSKFFISLSRAWLMGLACGSCRKWRQLGFWCSAWDKTREGYFCAECLGDKLAGAEWKVKMWEQQSKGK